MSYSLRFLFIFMMTLALSFGFMHLFFPGIDFHRLHIFLYNLCSGGTILLYYTENQNRMTSRTLLFFIGALIYAVMAFLEQYPVAIGLGVFLAIIVESVRVKAFSWFPSDFFTNKVPTAKKFHQAALLCLSLGLLMCSFAILNEEYGHWLSFEKLTLNTFFLGFSFPLSLVSLSIAFTMMHKAKTNAYRWLKVTSFWVISLGVVIFFVFILFESAILELFISCVLFLMVSAVLYMYVQIGIKEQQKAFLTSGITFLLFTSVTGVAYILLYYFDNVSLAERKVILHYHAMLALYGWNLSGLAVICRYNDFPIMLHEGKIVILHWIIVLFLAPLGYYFKGFAVAASIGYFIFLVILFFSKGTQQIPSFDRGESAVQSES